jgi:RimJ/RimL family protein N-acetyltransferase
MTEILDRQPSLIGASIALRPLRRDDFDSLYAVARDPLLWEQHPEPSRYEREVFQRFFDAALESGGALVAVDHGSGAIVGSSRFHGHDPVAREVEIGWSFLDRRLWGGPTNREMKRLMLDHAFQSVDTVIFRVGNDNIRSQKAVEKLGAERSGVIEGSGQQPAVVFRLTKRKYETGR